MDQGFNDLPDAVRRSLSGKCFVCGHDVAFVHKPGQSLREAYCPSCRASKRTRDLVRNIVRVYADDPGLSLEEALPQFEELAILEAQAEGAVHDRLKRLPGYVCTEYLDDVPPGQRSAKGVRCENLEALTFAEAAFDLVITQDVFEHIISPMRAFQEISRVLRTGGRHVFTVPLHEGQPSVIRVAVQNGKLVFLLPKLFHGDPLRPAGSLVFTDFGDDLPRLLEPLGMSTTTVTQDRYYAPEDIPLSRTAAEMQRYLECAGRGALLEYFFYNSVVFVSEKTGK